MQTNGNCLLIDTASYSRRPRCEKLSSSNEFILNYSTNIIHFNIIFHYVSKFRIILSMMTENQRSELFVSVTCFIRILYHINHVNYWYMKL